MTPDFVVKVGGSLYDLPDLKERLTGVLESLGSSRILIVPGGGDAADAIRVLDRCHDLGQERAHWLALSSLSLMGRFLVTLLPRLSFITQLSEAPALWNEGRSCVVDAHAFAVEDEGRPGCLPHEWTATSDAVAARIAVATGSRCLVLLKSVSLPRDGNWTTVAELGLVDPCFAKVVGQSSHLKIEWINLRETHRS
jgi:hypothetical protein